jgi:hypothetical protein
LWRWPFDGPILPRNPFDEFIDGQFRAAVFSEQTLVYSALMVCALTVAVVATSGGTRIASIAVLFAGIGASFSRGALILAASYVIVAVCHMAVLITVAGFYLSINSWLCLLSLWAISLGAAVAKPPWPTSTDVTESLSAPRPQSGSPAEGLTPTPVRS